MPSLTLTRKIRIFPTLQQEQVLRTLSERCRLLYNFALAERQQRWEANKTKPHEKRTYITYTKQQNDLPRIKKQFPEYAWVYSKVLQMVLRRLDEDFKSFFARWKNGDHKARSPRFKGKHYFTTLRYNQSGFSLDLDKKRISFSHNHPSNVALKFDLSWLPQITGKVKQIDIFRDKHCRWFIGIIIEENIPAYVNNGYFQAIDLGVINLVTAVNMHGKFIQIRNRRADLYWQRKIREVQSRRDHCRRLSRKWYRYDSKLKKMRQKMVYQLRDFQHKVSRSVVENTRANTIIIGTLNIKVMAKRKKSKLSFQSTKAKKTLNHSLMNTGFLGRFAEFLTYKANRVGKRVVRIDEAFTTQTCCVCGNMQYRQLSERSIQCNCGNSLDRDQNAAVNIMIRFLLQQPPVNGEPLQDFLDGLHRHTALPVLLRVVDSMETPA
jgi:putative transposase